MPKSQVFAFQTRVSDYLDLGASGELFGRAEMALAARIQTGGDPVEIKSAYLKCFDKNAQVFNAASGSVRGNIDGARGP